MPRFTNNEYADMMLVYGFCNGSGREARREYRRRYPLRITPSHSTFERINRSLRENGTFPTSKIRRERNNNEHHQEENILQLVEENPALSTRRIGSVVNKSNVSVWRVLNKEKLHPYHLQKVQSLLPGDEAARLTFCRWVLRRRVIIYRILFSDEAQFTKDGVFNTKNSHLWSRNNPHGIKKRNSQTKFSINVWCAIYNNKLIGPVFLPPRLNGEEYLNLLRNELPVLLRNANVNLRGMYFQQDGAPAHFTNEVREYLNEQYPQHWIGRGGPVNWPARSPDLTCLDYFLWGHLKSLVYSEEIRNSDHLRERITQACDQVKNNPDVIQKAVRNLEIRCRKCIETGGGIFENLL